MKVLGSKPRLPTNIKLKIMTQEEIKKYLKENLKLSWEHKNGNYYIVLKLDGEKVTELNFGEGY